MLAPSIAEAPFATPSGCPAAAGAAPLPVMGNPLAFIPPTPFTLTVQQHSPQYSPFLAGSAQQSAAAGKQDCSGGLPCGSSNPRAGSGVLRASSPPALDDRSGALRWLHGWAALASGEMEPSLGPPRAAPAAPRWAPCTSPGKRSATSCSPSDSSTAHSMLSGRHYSSPHSLAPAADSLLPPVPPGGHLACDTPPVGLPQRQPQQCRKRLTMAEHTIAWPAGATAPREQKRTRTVPTAPAWPRASEPAWAANLTQALNEAATAMR